MDADFCETLCYMEPNCVSYNLKKAAASENGKYKCELNNSTFEGQKNKLETKSEYLYRGAKNACRKRPCKNNATCQTGFTDAVCVLLDSREKTARQILTNVLKDHTSVVLMLCAITPRDLTTVLVIRDTMETAGVVIQFHRARKFTTKRYPTRAKPIC